MGNRQKLNPTQQELYSYLERQTEQVDFDLLQPFTTQEMGAALHISRNTVSQYLNEFFKEGWVIKINTRPVYYFCGRPCAGNSMSGRWRRNMRI